MVLFFFKCIKRDFNVFRAFADIFSNTAYECVIRRQLDEATRLFIIIITIIIIIIIRNLYSAIMPLGGYIGADNLSTRVIITSSVYSRRL